MQSISLHPSAASNEPPDLTLEVARLESALAERQSELATLREELHAFKVRYTQIVGGRLSELEDIEQAIKQAETHVLGVDAAADEDEMRAGAVSGAFESGAVPTGTALRKLFWSVAKVFHPDHALDDEEARRRHTIMAEASRAYREGDAESLHSLLGDENLHFYCAGGQNEDHAEDLATRLINLKEELRTVEFGLKRIKQDGVYRIKVPADEEAKQGRDALAAMAERTDRQIVKARRRLAHLS